MKHGELIRTTREARGWKRSQLAHAAGVDRGMLSRIEDGLLSGSVETLLKLARAMDMDLNPLKDGSGTDADSDSISSANDDSKLGNLPQVYDLSEDDIPTVLDPPTPVPSGA